MGIDGVRAVNYVTITQEGDYNGVVGSDEFIPALWYKSIAPDENDGIAYNNPGSDYGWFYEFGGTDNQPGPYALLNGIIRPPIDPAVFELKNPKQNIKGKVR